MAKIESVSLRLLRQHLGRWVDRAVFTQQPIQIMNNGTHVADLVPRPGADRPAGVGIDAAQAVVASTLKAAKKLGKKLRGNSPKKAGKRAYPAPKRPVPPAESAPTSS